MVSAVKEVFRQGVSAGAKAVKRNVAAGPSPLRRFSNASDDLVRLAAQGQIKNATLQGGPALISMCSGRHAEQELLDPAGAKKEVAFASLVPREDNKRNETFSRAFGKVIAEGDAVDPLVASEVQAVHKSDTGALNCGESHDAGISHRPQDPAEKDRVHRELRDGKGEQGCLNNEYRLSRRHVLKDGNKWVLKSHPDPRVEQLNLWCIGRMLRAKNIPLDEFIVVLPYEGKSVTLPFSQAQRHFVESTGVPMDKIVDVVKELARSVACSDAIEIDYMCRLAERVGRVTERAQRASDDALRPA